MITLKRCFEISLRHTDLPDASAEDGYGLTSRRKITIQVQNQVGRSR